MRAEQEIALQVAVKMLGLPDILLGHRWISSGDESALLPLERPAFARSVLRVRRASGAARIVARRLLMQLGQGACTVLKGEAGEPAWPEAVVGSLAHDSEVAVAAIALRRDFAALGVDIEPSEPLPSELIDIVATPRERERLGADPCDGRLLFAAKEAVYKAVFPLDRTFLDYHDVVVDLGTGEAVVRNGRILNVRLILYPRIMAVAFLRT